MFNTIYAHSDRFFNAASAASFVSAVQGFATEKYTRAALSIMATTALYMFPKTANMNMGLRVFSSLFCRRSNSYSTRSYVPRAEYNALGVLVQVNFKKSKVSSVFLNRRKFYSFDSDL